MIARHVVSGAYFRAGFAEVYAHVDIRMGAVHKVARYGYDIGVKGTYPLYEPFVIRTELRVVEIGDVDYPKAVFNARVGVSVFRHGQVLVVHDAEHRKA